MSRTALRWISPLLLCLPALAQEEKGKEWLPLVAESEYRYKAAFKGKESDETRVVKSCKVGGVNGFYFVDKSLASEANAIIGSALFGLGVYFIEGAQLKTMECFWKKDLEKPEGPAAQILLALPPVKDAEIVVQGNGGKKQIKVTVGGLEEVQVPAGLFKECIKLKVDEIWPEKNKTYSGAVWLAPGVGVVKWERGTGRVELLVSYKIPGR